MDTSEISPVPVNVLRGFLVALGFACWFGGEKLSTGSAMPREPQAAWWVRVVFAVAVTWLPAASCSV